MGDNDADSELRPIRTSDRILDNLNRGLTSEYRLSVRLTPTEYARIEHWQQVLQERTKGHYTATQKTVLLEALDALDAREAERVRKSSSRPSRSKKAPTS